MFNKINKFGVSPVVATALLLVVAVLSVVGFQGWFDNFSSSSLVDVERDSSSSSSYLRVEKIINNKLYLFSNEKSSVSSVRILDSNGVEMCFLNSFNQIESSGLLGWWKFDDDSSTIYDYSGNGNNGTFYGGDTILVMDFDNGDIDDKTSYNRSILGNYTVSNVGCLSGECVNFSGGNALSAEITISNGAQFIMDSSNSFSYSLWFNTSGLNGPAHQMGLFGKADSWLSYEYGILMTGPESEFEFVLSNSTDEISQTFLIGDYNKSHHLSLVYDKNDIKVYVDGVLKVDMVNNLTNNVHSDSLRFGKFREKNFNGTLDEISIYSRALSELEVLDLYNSKKAKFVNFEDSSLDSSLSFDGYGDYVDFPTLFNTGFPQNAGTIILYVKVDCNGSLNSNDYMLFDAYASNRNHFFLRCTSNGDFQFAAQQNGAGPYELGSVFGDNLGSSYDMISFSYDFSNSNNVSLYLNEDLIKNEMLDNISWRPYQQLFRLSQTTTGSFNGTYEEVRLFDRELSGLEINETYNNFIGANSVSGLKSVDVSSCSLNFGDRYEVLVADDTGIVNIETIAK